jgi:hypothetical protein
MANEVGLRQILKAVNAEAARLNFKAISYRRYMQLAEDGIVPKPENGKVDIIRALIHWMFYYRKLSESQGEAGLMEVRKRKETARAEREEIMVRKLKEELVLKNQAMAWLSLLVGNARAHFLGLSKRLAGQLVVMTDEKEIEYFIRIEVRQILEEFAAVLKKTK